MRRRGRLGRELGWRRGREGREWQKGRQGMAEREAGNGSNGEAGNAQFYKGGRWNGRKGGREWQIEWRQSTPFQGPKEAIAASYQGHRSTKAKWRCGAKAR